MTPEEYQNKLCSMEAEIVDYLGIEGAFREVLKALSSEQKEDIFQYIINNWDMDYNPEGGQEE